jgi:tetratricopeptide (TPR) repeat protein
LPDPGAFDKAIQYYRQAVKTNVRAMEGNKDATGDLDELLRIGGLAEDIGDYQLALDAYGLAVTSVGGSQTNWRRLRAARAHSEIGSVFAETNQAKQALESYQRSLEIYKSLLNDSDAETKNAAKIEMQRLRKIVTALLQQAPPK